MALAEHSGKMCPLRLPGCVSRPNISVPQARLLGCLGVFLDQTYISAPASSWFAGLSGLQASSQLLAARPIETPVNSWRSMPIADDSPACNLTDSGVCNSAHSLLLTSAHVKIDAHHWLMTQAREYDTYML